MQSFNHYLEKQASLLIKKATNMEKPASRQYVYRATLLTVYGFQVCIPVLLGIFAGIFLDRHFPLEHIAWTLNFILIGFLVGLYNANTWFYHMITSHHGKALNKKGENK